MTDTKKPRTPRNYESIKNGALSLSLEERAKLRDELIASVKNEVEQMQAATKLAEQLVKQG